MSGPKTRAAPSPGDDQVGSDDPRRADEESPNPALGQIPPDIGERVARREARRARGVKLAMFMGCLLVLAGVVLAGRAGAGHPTPPLALVLMAVGLVVAFPLAALLALLLGPTWEQRRQHYAYLHGKHGARSESRPSD